ncbi:MAG: ATP-binding protein [Dehalococcoidia bacterium]
MTLDTRPLVEFPAAPSTIEETGLDLGFIADLALKSLYFAGNVAGNVLSERIAIPQNITAEVLGFLRRERMLEVTGGSGLSPITLSYTLTTAGMARATSSLVMSGYSGPAPIPLDQYFEYVRRQSVQNVEITREMVEESLEHLVLAQHTIDLIGSAISSKRAFLMYGASGNGKSTAAEALRDALPGHILIPHAVEVMHQVIQVFDPSTHEPVDDAPVRSEDGRSLDARWVLIKRPIVLAAGELAPSHLELILDDVAKTYEAPIQMKANGGMLVIDDFGRQHLDAAYLLNRWIVPLEKGIDNLSLHSGVRFQTPFDVIPLFVTNRRPSDLVDDAFLRRIRYKIEIPSPDRERFIKILCLECERNELAYDDVVANYLVDEYFTKPERDMRGCHPRDLVEAIAASARYQGTSRELTKETIDEACKNYFA